MASLFCQYLVHFMMHVNNFVIYKSEPQMSRFLDAILTCAYFLFKE